MNWALGLLISQTGGYVLGTLARMIPQVNNVLVPRISAAGAFIANVVLLWSEFAKAAGLATQTVTALAPWAFPDTASVAICGGFFAMVAQIALPGVISIAQTALNRVIWELGGKHIQKVDPKQKAITKL